MKMKVFKGIYALKYMVLNYIIDKTFEDYGIKGLIELLDFIQAENIVSNMKEKEETK